MPLLPTRRRFMRCLISAVAPSREPPEYLITHFDADYLVECKELNCSVEHDGGTWTIEFNVYVTTSYPLGPTTTRRKVPSATLQTKLLEVLGIRTKLEGHPIYPSLTGRMRRRPDPDDMMAKLKDLLATTEVRLLYTEPNDSEYA